MGILWKGQEETASYVTIAINWAAASSRRLKAGSPIGADGKVTNSVKAIGLLADDIGYSVFNNTARLLVAGMVDEAAAVASFGSSYNDSVKEALDQITFVKANGQADHVVYAKASELSAYAKTEDLADYVKTEDLSDTPLDYVTLKSSTEGSTKVFKITVGDDGELTATEIVEPDPDPVEE